MKQLYNDSKIVFKYFRFSEREDTLTEYKNIDEKIKIPRDSPIYNLIDNSKYHLKI
jgi:hypothetical protein